MLADDAINSQEQCSILAKTTNRLDMSNLNVAINGIGSSTAAAVVDDNKQILSAVEKMNGKEKGHNLMNPAGINKAEECIIKEDDEKNDDGLCCNHLAAPYSFGTTAIHAGIQPQRWDMNQIVPPISLSATYQQPEPCKPIGHEYSREGSPTRDVLEESIAALEQARYCRVFSSGMGSTAAMANWIAAGGNVILFDDEYMGTQQYFNKVCREKHGIELSYIDLTKLDELQSALKENTKMVWFETPSNPRLKVVDIQAVAQIAKAYNPEIVVAVDNTLMSPLFQRPLALGADVVMHSMTKYINGHSDLLMGAIATNDKQIYEHLSFQQNSGGSVPSSFDAYLVIRSIKTLHLRMRQHMENGLAVAKRLEADPRVKKVLYPELESHPQYWVHKKQASGMSGMISFYLRGGLPACRQFLSNLKLIRMAASFGDCVSIVDFIPVIMRGGAPIPDPQHEEHSVDGDNLIRLSVGCEDLKDLLNDLDQALGAICC